MKGTRREYRITVEHQRHASIYREHRTTGWHAQRLLSQVMREHPNARAITIDLCEPTREPGSVVWWFAATRPDDAGKVARDVTI